MVDAPLQLPIFEGIDHAPTDEGNHGCCKKAEEQGSWFLWTARKSMLDSPEAYAIRKAALLGFCDIIPEQCKFSL